MFTFSLSTAVPYPEEVSRNVILVCCKNAKRLAAEEWLHCAAAYDSDVYLDASQITRLAGDLVAELPLPSWSALLTDDYAPIETMPF